MQPLRTHLQAMFKDSSISQQFPLREALAKTCLHILLLFSVVLQPFSRPALPG